MSAGKRRLPTSLAERTVRWITIGLLAFRTAVLPIAVSGSYDLVGGAARSYVVACLLLVALNLVLLQLTITGRCAAFRSSWGFSAADVLLAFGIDVWAAAVLEQGTILEPYRDAFWLYGMGTVGLLTVRHGIRVGVVATAGGLLVELLMVWVNGDRLDGAGWTQLAARGAWLTNGLVIPALVSRLAHTGAALAEAEGRRAGRASERVQQLRAMHDTALQKLGHIARRSVEDAPEAQRLRDIRTVALTEADRDTGQTRPSADLGCQLELLTEEFAGQTRVEVSVADLSSSPDEDTTECVVSAVREALNNSWRYGETDRATVTAVSSSTGFEVVVQDRGVGFDPADHPRGFGIDNSIRRPISEKGGTTEVYSAPGKGTRVTIKMPSADRVSRKGAGQPVIAVSLTRTISLESLTLVSLSWLAVAALGYRLTLSPIQLVSALANIEKGLPVSFWAAVTAVFTMDLVVLIGITTGRMRRLWLSSAFLAFDVGTALVLNLWSAVVVPAGEIMLPGREIFWSYTIGVVVYWTSLRRLKAATALTAGGLALLVAMATLNGVPLEGAALFQLAARQGYLILALAVAWLLTRLARRATDLAVDESLRAGRTEERAEALELLRKPVVGVLREIAEHAGDEAADPGQRLQEVRGLALQLINRLRDAIKPDDGAESSVLVGRLRVVAGMFRQLGLRVELITVELSAEPGPEVTEAVAGALHEALTNAWQHARVAHAVVRAADSEAGFEVVVRDHGRGFDVDGQPEGRGLSHAAYRPLAGLGGAVEIHSSGDGGTRVRISAPVSAERRAAVLGGGRGGA
ncbi:sensor histidine kinase [Streptomyces sp. NPDC020898]|uniref:sensor histidine kinase n=1 Tax=Streptomyces sp. NPDC020898 TaxID=3365101 RepID=UPI0037A91027